MLKRGKSENFYKKLFVEFGYTSLFAFVGVWKLFVALWAGLRYAVVLLFRGSLCWGTRNCVDVHSFSCWLCVPCVEKQYNSRRLPRKFRVRETNSRKENSRGKWFGYLGVYRRSWRYAKSASGECGEQWPFLLAVIKCRGKNNNCASDKISYLKDAISGIIRPCGWMQII